MDAQVFWDIIGNYNRQTMLIQIILFLFLILTIALSYMQKVKWAAKFGLGIANLFIGIGFFACYGTEPIQKYFALPLYLLCGALFLCESCCHRDDSLGKPSRWQILLLFLYMAYPLLSIALGNRFPKMVTYIMPCPVISLSIAVYTGYGRKNRLLLLLLVIGGLTGIKSIIFSAYEDLILLICGIYGAAILANEMKRQKQP